ncbi:hypothetical protein EMUR_01065 [Ehrlichia muris AS145]|uniref:Uncharacterized protein n=2 Tax=Ehrlichia muris TaxID=35795 RepID=V9R5L7_9RICK|nr:hypothetical protein EMUR_01065 [Ehrlichia muris AS145]
MMVMKHGEIHLNEQCKYGLGKPRSSSELRTFLKNLLDKKPKKVIDYNKLFIMISFIGLVIEAASSVLNLVSTHVFVSERTKHMAAVIFYITCIIVTVAMIISSALAIKESVNNKKLIQDSSETSGKKNSNESIKRNRLIKRQADIQISENSLTIISQLMWIVVSVTSLTMLFTVGNNPTLDQLSLFLSVTAPFLGILSCVLRLVDANISRKTGNSEKQKRQARSFTILCAVILAFEVIHCNCHILEAISLGGRMHDLYNYQNTAVLCLELVTVLVFIVAFFIEKYIDSKAEKEHDSGVNSHHSGSLDDASITSTESQLSIQGC